MDLQKRYEALAAELGHIISERRLMADREVEILGEMKSLRTLGTQIASQPPAAPEVKEGPRAVK